jgi:hypothetical protein
MRELDRFIINLRIGRLTKRLRGVEDYEDRCDIVKKTMKVTDKGMIDYWASYWWGRQFNDKDRK